MTIMLLAALASEKALLGSDVDAASAIRGAANDALIGRVNLARTEVDDGWRASRAPRAQCIEPDGFPLAL